MINARGQTPLSANVILPGNLKFYRLVNDSLPISEVITQELYLGSEKFWCLLQQPFLHPFRFWHPFSIDLNIKSNNNAKCKFTFSSIFCTMVHKMSRCHVSGIGCMQRRKSFRNWIRCSRALPQTQDLQQVQDLSITVFQFKLNCSTSFYQICTRFDVQTINLSSFL